MLYSALDVEYEETCIDTEQLQKILQNKAIYFDYFGPILFERNMCKLRNIIMEEKNRVPIKNIDTVMYFFCNIIQLAVKLIMRGYNMNLKSKPDEGYNECCICLV